MHYLEVALQKQSPRGVLLKRCFSVNFAKFLRTPFFYRTPPVGLFCTQRVEEEQKTTVDICTPSEERTLQWPIKNSKLNQQLKTFSKASTETLERNVKCEIGSKLTKKTPQCRNDVVQMFFFIVVVNLKEVIL